MLALKHYLDTYFAREILSSEHFIERTKENERHASELATKANLIRAGRARYQAKKTDLFYRAEIRKKKSSRE